MAQSLKSFRTAVSSLAKDIVTEAAAESFKAIRKHVDGSGGTDWDIGVVTGGVRDSLGIDPIVQRGWWTETVVGFDEGGLHPTGSNMAAVLSGLFNGTANRHGRPVINNTWAEELSSSLSDIPKAHGLIPS